MLARTFSGATLLLGLFVTAVEAQVPAPEIQIAGAVSPLPPAFRDSATVLGYRNYHRLVALRNGTGSMICLASDPSEKRWHVSCYHKDLGPFMAMGRELRDQGKTHAEIDSLREAAVAAGTLKMPDGPRMLYQLFAPADSVDPATGLAHGAAALQVVYIPYATTESTGLSAAPVAGLPWIMYPGKPWAHIMIMK